MKASGVKQIFFSLKIIFVEKNVCLPTEKVNKLKEMFKSWLKDPIFDALLWIKLAV